MYVIEWPGQNMFGIFSTLKSAQVWSERHFGPNWTKILKIHAVEEVEPIAKETK